MQKNCFNYPVEIVEDVFGESEKLSEALRAVSGGADSMALLWAMWLLKEKLEIRVEAAHFDHKLRGEESRRDAEFVRNFCDFHDIPLHLATGNVVPGPKGLEAAAREQIPEGAGRRHLPAPERRH